MDENDFLAARFEEHRAHLRAVAYRMLGSRAEADDAVQEAWLRLSRSDADEIENLRRLADDGRRARVRWTCCARARPGARSRWTGARPGPADRHRADAVDPEHEALLADSVGLALLVVLETLAPAERLAFVLHDMFAVPFDEIAPDGRPLPDRRAPARQPRPPPRPGRGAVARPGPARAAPVVDAFFAAARDGDFDGLVAVLHPDVVLRADGGAQRPASSSCAAPRTSRAGRMTLRPPRAVRAPGAGQRRRRRRRRARGPAVLGHGLHGRRRPDRRHRRAGGPRAPARSSTWPCSTTSRAGRRPRARWALSRRGSTSSRDRASGLQAAAPRPGR